HSMPCAANFARGRVDISAIAQLNRIGKTRCWTYDRLFTVMERSLSEREYLAEERSHGCEFLDGK
ncbi:MAG: hypothetical protein O7H39_14640, partial [Gammaproteobacteria bacterium]|nr:hypothetical protein [Gammaproteobacteria bacterium]